MLKSIDPLLNADLLWALRAMGHGDRIVVVDSNFPAHSVAWDTIMGRVLHAHAGTPRTVDAILSVMPLDSFVDDTIQCMAVIDAPETVPPLMAETQAVIDRHAGKSWPMIAIERFAFYEKARQTFALVQADERGFFGNVILAKGVVPPEA